MSSKLRTANLFKGYGIKTDDIQIEEPLHKSVGHIEITICTHATTKLVESITRLLVVILSYTKNKPDQTRVISYVNKSEKEVFKQVETLAGVIKIECAEE